MSAAAIGVDNRCLMKKRKKNNCTCDSINVDINHIIKDIYGFKHGRKRTVQFINDDTIINNCEIKKIIKRIKIQDTCNNTSTGKHEQYGNVSKQDEDHSLTLHSQDATCNNSEEVKIGVCSDTDRGSDSSLGGGSDSCLEGHSANCLGEDSANSLGDDSASCLGGSSASCLGGSSANCLGGSSSSCLNAVSNCCTSNNYTDNNNKINDCHPVYDDHYCENLDILKSHPNNNMTRNDSIRESLACREENKKLLSKQFELCIDNILESIRSCTEINQAKKIMIPVLSEFILNNFMCKDDYDKFQNTYKINLDTLQKEKKVLISAVKTQYKKIIQLQKLVGTQKCELKKKNDELNQIKAKVHQYFYDINNPNKKKFSILSPDVY
ncbi:hypothetical protein, conserved [Plasmodium gonderi]|uniref:Uncharacterized protein n=1 Tax=Plasmodium gonderi TaxID=77519 RepID=A0A1Y1JT06_PLAGO|nr:hypothetical protein, conserved [Plasmodium gonderi]GAW83074.1 hypothetical protein, conserved [Plasmodium gonderi]